MSKKLYITITGLFAFGFLRSNLLPFVTNDIVFVALFIWSLLGILLYARTVNYNNQRNRRWFYLILLLLFFGLLTPVMVYHQSIINTLVALRTNFLMIYFITLLCVAPSVNDIKESFAILSVISIFLAILVYFNPYLYATERELLGFEYNHSSGGTDVVATWPGIQALRMYFFFSLEDMIKKRDAKYLFICSFILVCLIIHQNRSTLLIALPLYLYGIIKSKTRYKQIIIMIICFIGVKYSYDLVLNLLEETNEQLNNSDYNRWQAFSFFLLEFESNIYTFLFGHGVPSVNSVYLNKLLEAQSSRFVFVSDIGMLGSYFYYGLLMLILYYRFVIKGLVNKQNPIFLRTYCLWIVMVPTIHHFGLGDLGGSIIFCYIFYLVIYYEAPQNRCIGNHR